MNVGHLAASIANLPWEKSGNEAAGDLKTKVAAVG
jgi:hypothetical protein